MPCTVIQLAFLVVRANTCLTLLLLRVLLIFSERMRNIVCILTGKHPVLALYIIIAVLNSIRSGDGFGERSGRAEADGGGHDGEGYQNAF